MITIAKKILLKITKGTNASISDRDARLSLSVITAGLDRFIGIGSTIVTMPITLDYLGPVQFGVWILISGFIGFISFSDLGIGMGLQNSLSKACGENNKEKPKYLVSSAYFLTFFAAAVISIMIWILEDVLPVSDLFNMDSEKNLATAIMALTYCVFIFLIGIPISLINRILNGFQTAYIANNVLLVGKIFALFSIFLAVWLDLGLVGLAVLFLASPLLVMFFFSLYFFTVNFDLMPRYRNVKIKYIKEILSGGLWTVFLQMVMASKMNMPVVIVSASLGSVAVAEYAIAHKFTGLGTMTITVALQSLWPVYGEAYSRGDHAWIVSALARSVKSVLILTGIGSCIFILLGQQVIEFWLGDSVIPTLASIVGFSLWMIVSSVNVCFAMLLNGTGNFKNQSLVSAIAVICALIIANIIAPDYGIIGVVLAMLCAELFRIPILYLEAKRVISKI